MADILNLGLNQIQVIPLAKGTISWHLGPATCIHTPPFWLPALSRVVQRKRPTAVRVMNLQFRLTNPLLDFAVTPLRGCLLITLER
jgi:hypothetical protein